MNAIGGYGHGDFTNGAELLTVSEVSALFAVSKMTVYRMIHSGELQHVQVGRSYRVIGESVRSILSGALNSR